MSLRFSFSPLKPCGNARTAPTLYLGNSKTQYTPQSQPSADWPRRATRSVYNNPSTAACLPKKAKPGCTGVCVCIYIYIFIYLSIHPSIYLSICVSIHLIHSTICSCAHWRPKQSHALYIYIYVYIYIHVYNESCILATHATL